MPEGLCQHERRTIEAGKASLEYLRRRTHENPLFAVLTGVFHSGAIPYQNNQQWVEHLVEKPYSEVKKLAEKPLEDRVRTMTIDRPKNLPSVYFARSRANMLPGALECFEDLCLDEPEKCFEKRTREKLVKCMVDKARGPIEEGTQRGGIGRKTSDLMREYLGDDEAVAVDRHVLRWVCEDAKVYCPIDLKTGKPLGSLEELEYGGTARGYKIPDEIYEACAEALREEARHCGIMPTQLQVGVWLKGVCGAPKRPRGPIFLGKGRGGLVTCPPPPEQVVFEVP